MSDVMMTLGPYRFGMDSAAYSELTRTTEYRWESQELIGARDAQQYTGPGEETISLPGVVYPHWRGGVRQIDEMRSLASQGRPLLLTDGVGRVWGRYVITRVDETQGVFLRQGLPRRQQFTLSLKRYD